MTQEQYNRALEISDKLRKLEELYKNRIQWRLSIMSCDTEIDTRIIKDIIFQHEIMIQLEIFEEIEKLKKEIEEL